MRLSIAIKARRRRRLTAPPAPLDPNELTLNLIDGSYVANGSSYADFPAYIAGDPATFARSAAAFYEDSTLTSVASGSPRVGSRGLLIEPSKTNLFSRSQELDSAYWNNNGGTRTADAVVAPDGTTTAEQWVGSNAGNGIYSTGFYFTAGTTYTFSVFWKPISGTASASIGIGGGAFNTGGSDRELFITPSGATTTYFTEATAYGVIPLANGWYRAWVKFTATATATSVAVLYYGPDSGSKTWSFWGAQIETGDLSSYIPTTSAPVTRPADDLVLSLPTGTTKLHVTLESGAVVLLSGLSAGNYSFPTNLAERYIKGISNMNPVGAAVGTPANSAPPVISGGPSVGATLTASAGTWTGDPAPTITRQWLRNGVPISGATGGTLSTAGYADGDVIVLRETAVNTAGTAVADSNSITLAPSGALPPILFVGVGNGSSTTQITSYNNTPLAGDFAVLVGASNTPSNRTVSAPLSLHRGTAEPNTSVLVASGVLSGADVLTTSVSMNRLRALVFRNAGRVIDFKVSSGNGTAIPAQAALNVSPRAIVYDYIYCETAGLTITPPANMPVALSSSGSGVSWGDRRTDALGITGTFVPGAAAFSGSGGDWVRISVALE